MSHRTALGRVRGLGSSQSGAHDWLLQKVSSAILAVLFLWFSFSFAMLLKVDYYVAREWISLPFNTVLLITFIATSIYHAILGLQVIIEDYVSQACRRVALIYAMKIILSMLGLGMILAILRAAMTIPMIWG